MAQFARPDSDVTVDDWTTSPLWSKIDEVSPNDSDYITGGGFANDVDTCEVGLSNVSDPSSSTGHIMRVRGRDFGFGGTTSSYRLRLMQGTTLIKQFIPAFTTSNATFSVTLSGTEADNITDYDNLRFQHRVQISGGIGEAGSVVTWCEFEVPTGPVQKSVSDSFSGADSRSISVTLSESDSFSGADARQTTVTFPPITDSLALTDADPVVEPSVFVSDSLSLADAFNIVKEILISLSDIVYPAGESRFDEVYFDKIYFDQRVILQHIIIVRKQLQDLITVLDNPQYTTFLHRFLDDSSTLVDVLQHITFLHRFIDDQTTPVDEPRYETFLHRFADDSQTILDELDIETILTHLRELSDIVYPTGVSAFDEVYFDKSYFDQQVQLIFDLVRQFSDAQTIVDDIRYETFLHRFLDDSSTLVDELFRKYVLHRFSDDATTLVDDFRYTTFLHRLLDETQTVVDEPRYITFLHRLLDETQTVVDEPRYTTFLHRFVADLQAVLDEIITQLISGALTFERELSDIVYPTGETRFDEVYWDKSYFDNRVQLIFDLVREFADTINILDNVRATFTLHRFNDDTVGVVDDIFRKYILHRFIDDSSTVVDDFFQTYILHRFFDETIPVVDEFGIETILTILRELSDRVYVAGKAGFDEVFWDKIYFDQDVQLIFDYVRQFTESQTIVDEARYITFLHRFFDDAQSILDEPRYETFLHRFLDDSQSILDELFTELTAIKTVLLSDIVYAAGKAGFDEVYWDKIYFDQDVQLLFDYVREFADILTLLDDVRYTTFLHRFGDDTQSVLDEPRYVTFLHRLLSETQTVLDELFTELSLIKNVLLSDIVYPAGETRFDEVYWDKTYFDQKVRLIFDYVRVFDDVLSVLDNPRYTTFLHRFVDETQPVLDEFGKFIDFVQALSDILTILDEAQAIKSAFKTVRLSEFIDFESFFDTAEFDQHHFDSRDVARITYTLHRRFAETIPILDAVRAFFDIGIIIELGDFIDFESFFDTAEFDEHHFDSEGDRIRITYILHRFFAEVLAAADDVAALREAVRRLSDATTLADTFFVFEGGLIIPFGSIIRLHRLSAVENALILFPLDVGVEKAERADSIQIPFGDDVIQATGTSKKRIRVDCLWVENGDQDEESLKDDLTALQNANQIMVTFFLQKLLTKNYRPVELETFSVQKVRGRSDILRVRLIFIEDTN